MLGAILGDFIGSVYEGRTHRIQTKEFPFIHPDCRFTDDTVLTVAIADALLSRTDYAIRLKQYYRRYPNAGYGKAFIQWGESEQMQPYNSWGNGSAMRVSPIAYHFNDLASVLAAAEQSAAVTHNHPEGIRGAQAIAAAIFLARTQANKQEIKTYVSDTFGYDLDRSLDSIRPTYQFDSSCQGSVPQAILAFLESTDIEDAIRNAVSLGGDSDTLACMAASIAEPFYGGLSAQQIRVITQQLDPTLQQVVQDFRQQHQLLA